jgi:hypothetical protein
MLLAPRVLGAQIRAHRPPPRSQVQCSGGWEMHAGRPEYRRVVALPPESGTGEARRCIEPDPIVKSPDLSRARQSARF